MANSSNLPAGAPAHPEGTSTVPRIPLPRTPSPTDFRELHVDPQDDSQTTSEQETAQDTLSVPNQPLSLNDASPAGKKSYYQSRNYASVQQPDVTEKRRKLRLSMRGKTIIVEYAEFMDWFVPAPPGEREPTDTMMSVDLRGVATTPERKMYKPLVDALNQDWLLPNDRAISNPDTPDRDADTDDKIDAELYRRSDVAMVGKKTRWAYMELSIECKTEDVQHDPFDELHPTGNHENASSTRQVILGQIMCYSGYIFDNQRRMHHYTLIIFGRMVRIIRWDRAGVVATKPFDYVAHPELLLSFIWRFARMTPAQRGHDPTATRIPRDGSLGKLMLERAKPPKPQGTGTNVNINIDQKPPQVGSQPATSDTEPTIPGDHPRASFAKSLKGNGTIWWRLRVDDAQGFRYFLVGNTHFRASGLAGRGTQTFIAIDEADPYGPFVYLKDAWRVAHTGIEQEGKILERLNSDDDGGPVPFVPTVRCHGDVEGQMTRSQEIWRLKNKGKSEEECPLKTHRHYRLVVNEVGKPLSKFRTMKELVGLITLSIGAHGQAYKRKGLIHRDISAGNVLIYPELVVNEEGVLEEVPKPLLADWELAECANSSEEAPRQPDRTGTWQFMSASALGEPSKRILVQDDIESFFHLLLYYAIRFCRHNWSDVGAFMDAYFDGYVKYEGVIYGGKEKLSTMRQGKLTTPLGDLALCFYMPEKSPDNSTPATLSDAVTPASPSMAAHTTDNLPQSSDTSASSTQPSKEDGPTKKAPPVPHPINNVFETFLSRLSAHYTLYVKRRAISTLETLPTPAAQAPTPATAKGMDAFMLAITPSTFKSKVVPQPNPVTELTPARKAELEPLAAELANHEAMVLLLLGHYWGTWPDDDRCHDQLPLDYKPNDEQRVFIGVKRGADATFDVSERPEKCSRVA
ncbi:hypothetical protein GY45DRAFT_1368783 [Cubamyces sp. BRFM 1775]|nr:hypothetical protein GY45DRAFT_1368783 [Cubamyces sp. BRFM 1775]